MQQILMQNQRDKTVQIMLTLDFSIFNLIKISKNQL